MFQSDYNRWYSGEINEEKLNMTPQFQAVLLYCIANNVCKIGADSFSLLGRHIGQIEIYYSTDIGPGFKINHGVGSVIDSQWLAADRGRHVLHADNPEALGRALTNKQI